MKKRIILALIIGAILAGLSLLYITRSDAPGYTYNSNSECQGMLGACSLDANLVKHRGFPFPLTTYSPPYGPISSATKGLNITYYMLNTIFYAAIVYIVLRLVDISKLKSNIKKRKKSKRPAKK